MPDVEAFWDRPVGVLVGNSMSWRLTEEPVATLVDVASPRPALVGSSNVDVASVELLALVHRSGSSRRGTVRGLSAAR
jgi:hypothetical protein